MKISTIAACSLATVSLLGGCSGGGGDDGEDVSYAGLAGEGDGLIARIGDNDVTAAENLPSGSVTYRGVAAYQTGDGDGIESFSDVDILSAIRMDADFATNSLSGRADDFRNQEGDTIPGSLTIQGGIDGNRYEADVGGTLTTDGQATVLRGELGGAIGGPNGELLVGFGEGTATGTTGEVDYQMVAVAER